MGVRDDGPLPLLLLPHRTPPTSTWRPTWGLTKQYALLPHRTQPPRVADACHIRPIIHCTLQVVIWWSFYLYSKVSNHIDFIFSSFCLHLLIVHPNTGSGIPERKFGTLGTDYLAFIVTPADRRIAQSLSVHSNFLFLFLFFFSRFWESVGWQRPPDHPHE